MKTPSGKAESTHSPYTLQNVDDAIAHLEQALSTYEALVVFSANYWRTRIMQVTVTPGLTNSQRQRLQRLLALLDGTART
ncbi:hypothetical protein FAZ95_01150 [Trinickia violacea]|uniref:Uncharacterized protein n=1 Tax=Trinickia violacea TaxID=2571746 RepID=A0A4P8IJR8_9BURK|nr:hypothetical protein FAZ95_01150 [Trinickia violacea]